MIYTHRVWPVIIASSTILEYLALRQAIHATRLIFLMIGLLGGSASWAQQGNAEEGKIIAYTCNGCHGIPYHQNVYPTYSVPRIGGQNYGYIVSALKAYRDGTRQHPTMNAQAHTLSDEDMHHVAAYFVSLTPASDEPSASGETP